MLRITRDGEYAIRAVLHLAAREGEGEGQGGGASLATDISRAEGVPRSYLSKILQRLRRAGLVRSKRGAGGGYALALPASRVTLANVIEAMDGPLGLNPCLDDDYSGTCTAGRRCPVRRVWSEAQRKVFEILDSYTLEDLAEEKRKNFLRKKETKKV